MVPKPTVRPSQSAAPERCPDARRGLRYYIRVTNEWLTKMGAGKLVASLQQRRSSSCPRLRYLAKVWRARATASRRAYLRWWRYQFAWWLWLPKNWRLLGACETGYGREPGNWTWDSGSYVSAFGIFRFGYADDAHRIGNLSWDETKKRLHRLPTPREQYEAALSHYRTHGDGWGCAGP